MKHEPDCRRPSGASRRQFLKFGIAGAAAALAGRSHSAAATADGQPLRIAFIGVGGKGLENLQSVASARGAAVVALCDVDSDSLNKAHGLFHDASVFSDYRVLLDQRGRDVDAVVVSTPDHMHGAIALAAMSLDKHVYLEKPLAHNLAELKRLTEVAAQRRVVTQTGTQIHSHECYRTAVDLLKRGVLGRVQNAHVWNGGRPVGILAERPTRVDEIPTTLDWKLWQGVAPERPYAKDTYQPFRWRHWRDYGCGTLGDMGCHLLDPLFSGLGLRPPRQVVSHGSPHLAETFALDSDVLFTFAGTSRTADQFTLRWTNGATAPDVGEHLPVGTTLPRAGSVVIGEQGVMLLPHWDMPVFYRKGVPWDVSPEPVPGEDHYHQWVAACRGEAVASTPFAYGGMLTETVLIGMVAGNFPHQTLHWNSTDWTFGLAAADALIHRTYRADWHPAGL